MFPQKPGLLSLKIFISWVLSYNSKYRCSCLTLKAQPNCSTIFRALLCHFKTWCHLKVGNYEETVTGSHSVAQCFQFPEKVILKSQVMHCQHAHLCNLFWLPKFLITWLQTSEGKQEPRFHCKSQSKLLLAKNE